MIPRQFKLVTLSSFFLVLIYLTSLPANASMVGSYHPDKLNNGQLIGPVWLEGEVVVLYNPNDPLMVDAATSVARSVSAVYTNVRLQPVRSLTGLNEAFNSHQDIMVAIWLFDTSLTDLKICKGVNLPWVSVADLVTLTPTIDHIFGLGNSEELVYAFESRGKTPSNLHVQPTASGVVDLKLSFVFTMWKLSEIFQKHASHGGDIYRKAGETLRNLCLRFFESNANDLMERNVEPKTPVGEVNQTDREQRFEELKAKYPNQVTNRAKFNTLAGEKTPPLYFKSNAPQMGFSDLLLSVLPLKSGLQGPIGFILDGLFDLLLSQGDADIVLSGDTVDLIFDAFQVILDLVGSGDPSEAASSALKSLLELLGNEFPFGEQLMPYLQLVIDGLFALKGDFDSISQFVQNLIMTLIPDSAGAVRSVVEQVMNLTAGVVDQIRSGEEVLTAFLRTMSTNLIQTFVSKLLNETLGVAQNLVGGYTEKLMAIVQIVVDLVAGDLDIQDIIQNHLSNLLVDVFNLIPESAKETVDKIIAVITFGFSILNTEKQKLIDRAKALLEEFLPEGLTDRLNQITMIAEYLISVIGQIREQGVDSYNLIKSQVLGIYGNLTGLIDSKLQSILENATLWVFGVLDEALSAVERNKFPNVQDMLTMVLNWASEEIEEIAPGVMENIQTLVDYALKIYGVVKNAPEMAQQLVSNTQDLFKEFLEDPVGKVIEPVLKLIFGDNNSIITTYLPKLQSFAEGLVGTYKIIANGELNSFQGVLQLLVSVVGTGIFKNFGVDLDPIIKVMKAIFPSFMGVDSPPAPMQAVQEILDILDDYASIPDFSTIRNYAEIVLEIVVGARELFTNGLQWIFGQVVEWLVGKVGKLIDDLLSDLVSSIGGSSALDQRMVDGKVLGHNESVYDQGLVSYNGTRSKLTAGGFVDPLLEIDLGADLGGFSLFSIKIGVGLKPNFAFDQQGFAQFLTDVIFKGSQVFSGDAGEFIKRIFSFMEISPLLTASIELGGFGTEENGFMNFLLESLGLEITFSGSGYFAMNLLTFKGGEFKFDNFLKIIEWGFTFTISISKTFTLLDFLTGGVGGGALSKVAEYLGLGGITVTITFGLTIEIIKRAASASGPEEASFTLEIFIACTITIGISLVIVGITLKGSVEIILTFFQDLANPAPLKIFLDVIFKFTVVLEFLFWDWDSTYTWHAVHEDLTPSGKDAMKENGGKGFDTDKDGLSDDYEDRTPGLDSTTADSDGDGLDDKYETQTLGTDPSKADTDGDGLTDQYEVEVSYTNPLVRDTDYDGLGDYEEVIMYNTDPFERDTDSDGLDDNFEVTYSWNLTGITPSVTSVVIGGISYNDHTDPLVADTDGDGMLDGQEGERGPWYGKPDLRPPGISEEYDVVFFGGYTHPLDNDTDDDSFEQLVNGTISYRYLFMRDMGDGVEINGQYVTFIVEGEPELRLVRTNPVRPDSDGDTGYTGPMNPAPINRFMNSDGYELSLSPPSDPLDGDTDDDGLMDGLEGTLSYDSNRTNYNNPDTDGDGLGDMQEFLLGSDPRAVDTDNDMVPDGDEYLIYGTSVFLNDTDFDGLTDGQELFWFHTSPFLQDSDGDGLLDGDELFRYYSDPMDDDSDRDGLSDFEEVMIYNTVVNDEDTDDDGLLDGDEINLYKTSPFLWDTDNDSIYYPDPTQETGISMRWGDYEEVMSNRSDPTIADSDTDGIPDGWEVYLGTDHVPFLNPIPLDPSSNDTDGDGILDGQELWIANTTNLIYPFISYHLVYPFVTSPVKADTDDDGITDSLEIRNYSTSPFTNDTDNDTLTDFEELFFHKTNPLKADTDGDGLLDCEEQTEVYYNESIGLPMFSKYNSSENITIYPTNASDPDSDGDLLPDGVELFFYFNVSASINRTYDPTLWDENNNTIPDGLELDSDFDGLPDGLEFMGNLTGPRPYNSTYDSGGNGAGGPLQPDSDYDGLPDGLEVFNLFTSPVNNDTDADSFSDGLEVRLGTDPLNTTSWDDITTAMANYTLVMINSPVSAVYMGSFVPLKVSAPSDALKVTANLYNGQTGEWTGERELVFDPLSQGWVPSEGAWILDAGNYYVRTFAYLEAGDVVSDGLSFAVKVPLVHYIFEAIAPKESPTYFFFFGGFLLLGILAGVAAPTLTRRISRRQEEN